MTEEILLGRAGGPTKEIPLGRAEGATKEAPLGRTEETPLGQGFVPGDVARIEVGLFSHEMNLEEVLAFFEHEGDAEGDESLLIELRGHPKETEPPSGGVKHSGVSLRAIIPADALPGVYRFRRLEAKTYGGRRVPFDENTQDRWGRWRFLVREEPDTLPTI